MKILAIETSCDETAAAVVQDGRRVLSSAVASQIEEHRLYGGVVPEIASRRHAEAITQIVDEALRRANTTIHGVDAVAVTNSPGLIGSLLVGVNFAKGLSLAAGKPLIPVHHLRSHIAANYVIHRELSPPFICLVVSGGHSHIIEVKDYTDMRVIGRTRDDAAGEAFDKAARAMGLPYPGGVHLDKIADRGDASRFSFPNPKVTGAEYDLSFSGLKTSVVNLIHNTEQKGNALPVEDLSASFREAVVGCLMDKFIKASNDTRYDKIVCAGGVSANRLLRRRLREFADQQGKSLFVPTLDLCTDNAVMVGAQAYFEYKAGNLAGYDLNAYATMPIDNIGETVIQ